VILIGLGSNLSGPHHKTSFDVLLSARQIMAQKGLVPVRASRFWQTQPVPKSDQPWYCNQVVEIETCRDPRIVLHMLHQIEAMFGRIRNPSRRNEPRILDLDLLTYHRVVLDEPGITLPHPRLHERGFVLYPLRDVAPGFVHPILNKSVNLMIRDLPVSSGECFPLNAVNRATPRPGLF
jgi:2-amino-4-hydroxy-6-hydroxymethyldihydropteridine diphosphokinase